MTNCLYWLRWLGMVLLAAPLVLVSVGSRAWAEAEGPGSVLTPPVNLQLRAGSSQEPPSRLLDPGHPGWKQTPVCRPLLSRTPRLYVTEPVKPRPVPALEVRALCCSDQLLLRLEWDDATRDAPVSPPAKKGTGGTPDRIYKRSTTDPDAFADAAAVMVPANWNGGRFPSLVMGDTTTPVRLYYWNAARSAEEMAGTGRATPQPVGRSLPHRATHDQGRWTLTLQLAAPPEGSPVAFALWNGHLGDRDGLKVFSIWYVLTGAGHPSERTGASPAAGAKHDKH